MTFIILKLPFLRIVRSLNHVCCEPSIVHDNLDYSSIYDE